MLPMLIGTVITGPIGGSLTDRYGTRLFATLGIDPALFFTARRAIHTRFTYFSPISYWPSFTVWLRFSIYLSVTLVLVGAIFSYIRSKKHVTEDDLSNDDAQIQKTQLILNIR